MSDWALAQEIWHDTFSVALEKWQQQIPDNPSSWLLTCAKNKAIDRLRHNNMTLEKSRLIQALAAVNETSVVEHDFSDELLRLIFSCCHPAIEYKNQIALTLHTVCGLTTKQIADALIINTKTLEQRLTRAKTKIKQAKIPYTIPSKKELVQRIDAVLKVIYLVFNTGYDSERTVDSANAQDQSVDLANEAIRLAKLLTDLMPDHAEPEGLLALLMFHISRRNARLDNKLDLVLMEHQDRKLWDQDLIQHADQLLQAALKKKQIGSYQLQAAIAGVHCLAPQASETDWLHIEGLYHLLMQLDNNPIIQLNAAVAIAMSRGIDIGLKQIDQLESLKSLQGYSLFYSAKADLLNRIGEKETAYRYYQKALQLTDKTREQSFYQKKITRLQSEIRDAKKPIA